MSLFYACAQLVNRRNCPVADIRGYVLNVNELHWLQHSMRIASIRTGLPHGKVESLVCFGACMDVQDRLIRATWLSLLITDPAPC